MVLFMILKGIRVIDLTRLISGPITTRILADFGAEVIKVQSRKISQGMENPSHPFFSYLNRNKKSITLNLDKPEAKELLLRLSEKSDMIIENFSPRVMENFGLTYEKFLSRNPSIIMLSISSMGKDGPFRDFICFSPTFHALSSLTYLTSKRLKRPCHIGFAYADMIIGLYGAIIAIAALIQRKHRKIGEFIELSGLEALITLVGEEIIKSSFRRKRIENPFPYYESFLSLDKRYVVVSVENKEEERRIGLAFGKNIKEKKALKVLLKDWIRRHPASKIEAFFQKKGIKAIFIRNARDLACDPFLTDFFFDLEGKRMIKSPLRSIEDRSKEWTKAPSIGEHNRYVFIELLGLKEEEFEDYIERKIIY